MRMQLPIVTNSNFGPITISEIWRLIGKKSPIYSYLPYSYLMPSLRVIPFEIWDDLISTKTRITGISVREEIMKLGLLIYYFRQTDGHLYYNNSSVCIACFCYCAGKNITECYHS